MDTKTTNKDTPGSRQGDHGLGTPRSRMDGARVLSDQEIEETQRLEQEDSRQQSEIQPQQLAKVEPQAMAADPPVPGTDDHQPETPPSPSDAATVLSDQEIGETQRLEQDESRRQSDTEPQPFATVEPDTTTTEAPEPATGDHRSDTVPSPKEPSPVLSAQEVESTPRLDDPESQQSSDTQPQQLAKLGAEGTTMDSPELTQGDHGLGTPRSRMDGARVLSEQESQQSYGTEVQQVANLDAEATTTDFPELRQGDHGLGTPRSRMDGARVLSEQEIEEARCVEDQALRRQFEKELQQPAAFALPSGIRRALTWGGLALAAVLGLFVVSQVTAAISSIATLPVPFNWIMGFLALLFAGILTWMILRLAVALFRLQRSPSVNLRAIQALQERRHMQALVEEHAEQAIHKLRNYLENYQLNDEACRRLKGLGLTDGEWDSLVLERRSLLANDESKPSDAWLSEFRSQFQSILDRAAERRIKHWATRVAAGTAVSRLAVLDNGAVLYACAAMIEELTFLYGLRPAVGQTAAILARSIQQTYFAGLAQQGTEAIMDTLWSETSGIVGDLVGRVLPRVAEGAVNGALLWRLGKRAIASLQPVQTAN